MHLIKFTYLYVNTASPFIFFSLFNVKVSYLGGKMAKCGSEGIKVSVNVF